MIYNSLFCNILTFLAIFFLHILTAMLFRTTIIKKQKGFIMYTILKGNFNIRHSKDFIMRQPSGIDSYILLIVRTPARFFIGNSTYTVKQPSAFIIRPGIPYSYSGLDDEYINDFCASFQASVVDCIVNRLTNAIGDVRVMNAKPKTLVVAGGVAKNSAIRGALEKMSQKYNMTFAAPPMNLCTDNGAMIAWAGLENWRVGNIVTEPIAPRPRWSLTEL